MQETRHEISLRLSAAREDMLIARMALSGLGMLAGLDADLIGDLRTVTNECFDCLIYGSVAPRYILVEASIKEERLFIRFSAEGEAEQSPDDEQPDMDVIRGVLETLMPQVALFTNQHGVNSIECSMPV